MFEGTGYIVHKNDEIKKCALIIAPAALSPALKTADMAPVAWYVNNWSDHI
jgi:hypothetical protein